MTMKKAIMLLVTTMFFHHMDCVLSFLPIEKQSPRCKQNKDIIFSRRSKIALLSNEYLENDLVSVLIPEKFRSEIITESSDDKETISILCVVRPDGGIHPLCIHEDDNENDLFVHPKIAYLPWTDGINDDDVQALYGEGWFGQRVVPSLGGGPGYGAEADDVWTVDEEVLKHVRDDNVVIPVLDLGIAHGEKARGGAI